MIQMYGVISLIPSHSSEFFFYNDASRYFFRWLTTAVWKKRGNLAVVVLCDCVTHLIGFWTGWEGGQMRAREVARNRRDTAARIRSCSHSRLPWLAIEPYAPRPAAGHSTYACETAVRPGRAGAGGELSKSLWALKPCSSATATMHVWDSHVLPYTLGWLRAVSKYAGFGCE